MSAPLSPQEQALLTEEDKSKGLRLDCQAKAMGDVTVHLPQEKQEHILTSGVVPFFIRQPWAERRGHRADYSVPAPKGRSIGNAAGIGAAMLLQSSTLLTLSEQVARQAETIELSADSLLRHTEFFKEGIL